MRRALMVSAALAMWAGTAGAQTGPRIFISVDMEGISGVGTGAMTSSGGKDYATARRLMTDDVNAVVEAIFARGLSRRPSERPPHGLGPTRDLHPGFHQAPGHGLRA